MRFPRAWNALWSSPNYQQYGEKEACLLICRYQYSGFMGINSRIRRCSQNFEEFKLAVHKLYPESESERKWTIVDMDKLVGEQLWMGILNVNDLGNYYQMFYFITKFLLNKNQISEAEQS
jgi:hypothetical protein